MCYKPIIIAAMAIMCISTSAKDIYLFSGTETSPVKEFADVHKLTFADNAMNVTESNGTETVVALADFDYFTFDRPSGVAAIETCNIAVTADAKGNIAITAETPISSVAVYSAMGGTVLKATPKAPGCSISIEGQSAGTYLVSVTAGKTTKVQKIVKR
ncbi:MAG: T9SS type A sorting domain-containing protein [Muribaculaceae bacterium]